MSKPLTGILYHLQQPYGTRRLGKVTTPTHAVQHDEYVLYLPPPGSKGRLACLGRKIEFAVLYLGITLMPPINKVRLEYTSSPPDEINITHSRRGF